MSASPSRRLVLDPALLAVVAVVLALGVFMELYYLRARPRPLAEDQQVGLIGLDGCTKCVDVEDALCAVKLGLAPAALYAARATLVQERAISLEKAEHGDEISAQLLGLGEVMAARYYALHVYHDAALLRPEIAAWRLTRDRERCLGGASQLLDPQAAQRFEAELFEGWERSWQALLADNPSYTGHPKGRILVAPAPTD